MNLIFQVFYRDIKNRSPSWVILQHLLRSIDIEKSNVFRIFLAIIQEIQIQTPIVPQSIHQYASLLIDTSTVARYRYEPMKIQQDLR